MTNLETLLAADPVVPTISERHVQAVARLLHWRWGPYEDCECDDDLCWVSSVRVVLELSKLVVGAPSSTPEGPQ